MSCPLLPSKADVWVNVPIGRVGKDNYLLFEFPESLDIVRRILDVQMGADDCLVFDQA